LLNKDLTFLAPQYGQPRRQISVGFRSGGSVRALREPCLNLEALCLPGLALVILAIGWLQYHWINQVSQAQQMQATGRLREETRLLSVALDTEITRAALVFTLSPAPASSIFDALEQRWGVWNRDARWPKIVAGVSLAEWTAVGWRERSLGDPGTVDVRPILPDKGSIEPPPTEETSGLSHGEVRVPDGFVHDQPYLLRPIPTISDRPGSPHVMNWLVIHYDLNYVANSVLPQLLEKYATAEDRLDFQFRLVPKGSIATEAIMSTDEFHFRPECFVAQARRVGVSIQPPGLHHGGQRMFEATGTLPMVFPKATPASPGAPDGPPLVANTSPFSAIGEVTLDSLIHAVDHCESPASPSNPGLMQLAVSAPHSALGAVYSGFRRRNEILGGLVLVVLLAALAALVIFMERARRLARLQAVVAAGISHELRTPLASLSVAVDHLKKGHVQNVEQARRYGEILEAQSRRLRDVVDQALALTKLSQPKALPSPRPVSLPQIVQAGVDSLAPGIKQAGIDVLFDTAPDLPMISAEPEFVLRCVVNLVENAIKYAGGGGSIQVSAKATVHAKRKGVEMVIEDRGTGIPDEEAEAIFEPFYRGSSARRSRQPGSGLGLAIVKSAAEAYGGWIKFERANPQGCRFRVFFPSADHDDSPLLAESEV
jgi:signal transduction histidine kinase